MRHARARVRGSRHVALVLWHGPCGERLAAHARLGRRARSAHWNAAMPGRARVRTRAATRSRSHQVETEIKLIYYQNLNYPNLLLMF